MSIYQVRHSLELLAQEEYKSGHLTEAELQRLLGFGARYKLDGFLKAHGVMIDNYTADHLRREVSDLDRLGFWRGETCHRRSERRIRDPDSPAIVRDWIAKGPQWLEIN